MDQVVTTTSTMLTEGQFFLLLSFALVIIQFLYRAWDKRDNKAIIGAMTANNENILKTLSESNEKILKALGDNNSTTMQVINKTVEQFGPHLERNRKILGMVQELQAMHNVRDEDGRFIWYMPKEIIETLRELTKLTNTVAGTQESIAKIMEKQNIDFSTLLVAFKDFMVDHKDRCRDQFDAIRSEVRNR